MCLKNMRMDGSAELAQNPPESRNCLIYLIAGLVLIAGVAGYFYTTFLYGSPGGFLAELRSPPAEDKLKVLRSDAIEQITLAQNGLGALEGLDFFEQTYSDMCAKGEHGWKRSDSFAYMCAYRLTYYYGTNRDYGELLLDLEKTLDTGEWDIEGRSPLQPTISEALQTGSDEIFLLELPDYRKKITATQKSGYVTLSINSFHGYGVPWTRSNDEPSPFGIGLGLN